MTKKQIGLLSAYRTAYNKGPKTELHQVYGKFSSAKHTALNDCKALQKRLGGYDATIVGASSHFFSYAFKYMDYDLNRECLCYCTHANDYKFPID